VAPTSLAVLVASGLDYCALGLAHSAAILHDAPWVVYPGTLQTRRVDADGWGPKGAYLVDVHDGTVAEPEFVALDQVRFERVEHPIDGISDLATLRDRLVDRGRALLAAADDRSVLVQLELVGRGPVHAELHRPGSIAELVDSLRAESLTEAPLLWWHAVAAATRGVQDLTELQGRNDFVADLVDEAAGLLSDAEARRRRVDGWDEELPSDLAHLLDDALPDASDPARWVQAQDLAVELVAGDET
jgi:DNA repair protein SbcD/Mre11